VWTVLRVVAFAATFELLRRGCLTGSVFVTVSIVESIMGPCFTRLRYSLRMQWRSMARHGTTRDGFSAPAAARPFSHAPATKSNCTWEPWMLLTNSYQPTKAGSSIVSPGCRRFRSRNDMSVVVTTRIALRSKYPEISTGRTCCTGTLDLTWLVEEEISASGSEHSQSCRSTN
jgi:hypothetical protein